MNLETYLVGWNENPPAWSGSKALIIIETGAPIALLMYSINRVIIGVRCVKMLKEFISVATGNCLQK
jgi:hypothetical protein